MTPDELDEEATQAEHDRTASWLAIGQGAEATMIRALLAPLLIITVSVLLTVVACAASAGAATSGGWTYSGTVTGKGYEPPRPGVVECSGTGRTPGSCRTVDQPECWRLDLRNGIFAGWACAPDRATWDRVRIGEWWPS